MPTAVSSPTTGTTTNNYLFTGEQLDPNSNLYYLRARYYDPEVGRFNSRDPFAGSLSDPVSLHKYLYAQNNPVFYVDPTGELVDIKETAIVSAIINIIASIAIDIGVNKKKFGLDVLINAGIAGIIGGLTGGAGAAAGNAITVRIVASEQPVPY